MIRILPGAGRRLVLGAVLGGALVALPQALPPLEAQSPERAGDGVLGRVVVVVVSGTAGEDLAEAIEVELITLGEAASVGVERASAPGGRAEFSVPTDPMLTHVPRVRYQGVQYFGDPVLLSPELPAAEVSVRVFERAQEPPPLSIRETTVTVLALDRAAAELTLVREDLVENPSDRVYVGPPPSGVTLRLPLPERTLDASGLNEEGSFQLGSGTLDASLPLRPGITPVVTTYRVGYDPARDGYRLRVTAPLPTARVEVLVPDRFVEELAPLDAAEHGPAAQLEGELALVARRGEAARAGEGTLVELRGLAGSTASNPLTDGRGPFAATALALVLLPAAAWALQRAGSRRGVRKP
ncbi:MAG: hypothetical protein OXC94_04445 [Chloroflexi bacterium]|nr:hypothetical protein [Chloroflexota bacterium]